MTQSNNSTIIIPTQPDRPTLGYFADLEAAKYRLMSDGGMWAIDNRCPFDEVTPCPGKPCETCQIFWDTKEGKL